MVSLIGTHKYIRIYIFGSAVVKNPPASAGDTRDTGSIPGLGRSPGGGNSNLLQYSCLKIFTDRGAWWATIHRDLKESDTVEHTHTSHSRHFASQSFFLSFLSLLTLLQYCFCFMFWFFGQEACGILVLLQLWIETSPSAFKGEVLATGPPGKSHHSFFFSNPNPMQQPKSSWSWNLV